MAVQNKVKAIRTIWEDRDVEPYEFIESINIKHTDFENDNRIWIDFIIYDYEINKICTILIEDEEIIGFNSTHFIPKLEINKMFDFVESVINTI